MTFRFDLPAKATLMARPHPERKWRICTRNEGIGKASSWSDSEGSIAVVRKAVKCYQSHRFFTLCHRSAFPFFPQGFSASCKRARRYPECQRRIRTRNEGAGKASSWSDSEGSIAVVRKAVKCHQRHRFFTLCHRFVFRLFYKAFLPPFRMTGDGEMSYWTTVKDLSPWWGKPVRGHSACSWRICTRDEGNIRPYGGSGFITLCRFRVTIKVL